MSEPSNPWVSGVSGLFTTEFYGRVRSYLIGRRRVRPVAPRLRAGRRAGAERARRRCTRTSASYEIYLVPSGDLLVVASNRPTLPAPDWSVFGLPALRTDLCRFRPLDRPTARSAAPRRPARAGAAARDQGSAAPTPTSIPVLDLGAERRRFRHDFAVGLPRPLADWFNLLPRCAGAGAARRAIRSPALPENPRVRARALGALLRSRPPTGADR